GRRSRHRPPPARVPGPGRTAAATTLAHGRGDRNPAPRLDRRPDQLPGPPLRLRGRDGPAEAAPEAPPAALDGRPNRRGGRTGGPPRLPPPARHSRLGRPARLLRDPHR